MGKLVSLFFIFLFWNVCFFYASKSARKDMLMHSSKKYSKSVYQSFFLLIGIFSLINSVGGDYARYKEFVEGGYLDSFYYDNFGYEKLYIYLASISRGSLLIWKIFVYGLSVFISYYSVVKYKNSSGIILLMVTICILPSYGITRAVLAYSIYLLGVIIFYQQTFRHKIWGVVLILCSYAAHTSMIIPILLFPLSFIKLTPKRLVIAICLAPFIITAINNIPSVIESLLGDSNSMLLYKFNTYSNEEKDAYNAYRSFLSTIYGVMDFVLIMTIICYAIKSLFKREHNALYKHIVMTSFLMAYFSLIFKFSDLYASAILYQRFFTMIPFFIYFIIPDFVSQGSRKEFNIITRLGYITVSFFFVMEMYYASFN